MPGLCVDDRGAQGRERDPGRDALQQPRDDQIDRVGRQNEDGQGDDVD